MTIYKRWSSQRISSAGWAECQSENRENRPEMWRKQSWRNWIWSREISCKVWARFCNMKLYEFRTERPRVSTFVYYKLVLKWDNFECKWQITIIKFLFRKTSHCLWLNPFLENSGMVPRSRPIRRHFNQTSQLPRVRLLATRWIFIKTISVSLFSSCIKINPIKTPAILALIKRVNQDLSKFSRFFTFFLDFSLNELIIAKMAIPTAKIEMDCRKNEDSFLGLILGMDKV